MFYSVSVGSKVRQPRAHLLRPLDGMRAVQNARSSIGSRPTPCFKQRSMAAKKTPDSTSGKPSQSGNTSPGATTSARSTVSGPARTRSDGKPSPADAAVKKVTATQALAASFPFNPNKSQEYGKATRTPPTGHPVNAPDPSATGSTLTETVPSPKVGGGRPTLGFNPGNLPLDRVRVDSSGQPMTTNFGVPIANNQHSLKAGLRGPALLEDFILREKITHSNPRADRSCARLSCPWIFRMLPIDGVGHARVDLRKGWQTNTRIHPIFDSGRGARFGRYSARRPRLRGKILHGRRKLGSRRQQHSCLLHPRRDEVS